MKSVRMHNPPHPGEILRELCLTPLNLTVTDAAASLDVSRNTLSAILNGRASIDRIWHDRRELAASTDAIRSLACRAVTEATARAKDRGRIR
jgi:addiction module HigA family antidote